MALSDIATNSEGGMKLVPSEGIVRRILKSGVTVVVGSCMAIDDNNQFLLPAGDDDTRACVFALEAATGDGVIEIDAAMAVAGAPFIGNAEILEGKTIASKGTAGKVAASTTAGAVLGTVVRKCAGDGKRGYVNQLSK